MNAALSEELYQRALTDGAWVDLSARSKYRLMGGDRVRFLNGQVTQNIKTLDTSRAVYTCVTNVKGRVQFDAWVHADADSLWIDSAEGVQEDLFARLDRYLIADDVEIQEVPDSWDLWYAWGVTAKEFEQQGLPEGAKIRQSERVHGFPGIDLWIPRHLAWLPSSTQLSTEAFDAWRILNGTPKFPNELNDQMFPQEAGLESRVMDFHKGCYIGQEILSRIKMSGKMPRQLVRFSLESDKVNTAAPQQLALLGTTGEPTVLGPVTSWTQHPSSNHVVGLAYLRYQSHNDFSLLIVDEHLPRISDEVQLIAL